MATLAGLVLTALPLAADEQRETPLTPAAEMATFQLADPRLSVELVASEPDLDSPVAISWDADGKLYVAEMIDYPVGPTAGRIRLLEDRDGDGRYEHARVFAEGLNFPNGVLAAQGGVFVTAAPDLLFLKDTDGDGKADEKTVVFTGFGEGNQQLRANGLRWGLDNWIYGANGRSDGIVRRPQDPPEKAVSIRGKDFRFRPDGSKFEAISGGSQFGQACDDWGNRFVSWNTIPLRHALFDQAFLDRNPRLSGLGVRDIADPTDTGRVYPISPRPQTFNRERTDYYNALCGLTIYRGDALGPDYAGNAFVGESLTNLVHRRVLTPVGPTFISRRGETDREFLASSDSWFHPVFIATGPDGALYVVDFYRRWVEHPAFVAPGLGEGVDWRKGSGHGRIWRIAPREQKRSPSTAPALTGESDASLVRQLESHNGWYRDTAARLLVERHATQAAGELKAIVEKTKLPQAKLHALSILDSLAELDDDTLLRAIADPHEQVQRHALRLAEPRLAASPRLRAALIGTATSPSALVRWQAALSLGTVEGADKAAAMAALANSDPNDTELATAIVGSLGQDAVPFLQQLLTSDRNWRKTPTAAQINLLKLTAATACGAGDDALAATCAQLVTQPPGASVAPGDLALLIGMTQGLADRGKSLRQWLAEGAKDPSPRALPADKIIALLPAARAVAAGEDQPLPNRLLAIEMIGMLDPASGPTLLELLDARCDQAVQSAAANALSHAEDETAQSMFESWSERTTATQRALLAAALRSAPAARALVAALEEGAIQARELDAGTRDGLAAIRDADLQLRIKKILAADAANSNRQEVVDRFKPLLTREGDRRRGAAVFEKNCLTCHSLQGRGHRVGPDLSGIGGRPKETLLVDLFDPSLQIAGDFRAYTLITRDGQVLTGLVQSETSGGVTMARGEGVQDMVLRDQIEELRSTGKSLMPDGLEQTLSEDNLVDLLAFLAQPDAQLFSPPK